MRLRPTVGDWVVLFAALLCFLAAFSNLVVTKSINQWNKNRAKAKARQVDKQMLAPPTRARRLPDFNKLPQTDTNLFIETSE